MNIDSKQDKHTDIKTERERDNAAPAGKGDTLVPTESWRFIENVEGLHFSRYPSEVEFRKELKKWASASDVQEMWFTEDKPADEEILFLSFCSDSLGAVHLFCNTTCYLMNDQGRNIQKLI